MRTLTKILLCLALLTTTFNRTHAQETFAPLISENCIAFVHVDFRKVEFDAVKDSIQVLGESLLRALGFDDKSFKATARELTVELEKLDVLVRPTWETITKGLGITEIAMIADFNLLEHDAPVILVIPWKNKTDEQLQMLITLLQLKADDFVKVGDFLIGDEVRRIEKTAAVVKGWLAKDAPANSAIHEALKSVADAEIKVAIAPPEQLRFILQNAPLPPDMPQEVRNLILDLFSNFLYVEFRYF